jgi:hypothetical protein
MCDCLKGGRRGQDSGVWGGRLEDYSLLCNKPSSTMWLLKFMFYSFGKILILVKAVWEGSLHLDEDSTGRPSGRRWKVQVPPVQASCSLGREKRKGKMKPHTLPGSLIIFGCVKKVLCPALFFFFF